MKKFLIAVLMLVLSLFLVMLSACGKGEEKNEPELPKMTVTVSGIVVSEGEPQEGVKVTVKDSRDNLYGTVTTAADGKFAVDNVSKTRAASVSFEKEGYFLKTVELSISDITSGKNEMGNVELEKPSEFKTLKGKVVGLDGEIGIGGVTVSVPGFSNTAVSEADGTFELKDVPLSSTGVTLATSKALYATVEKEIVKADIGADGDIGVLESYIEIPAIDGSAATAFTLVRGETSFKLYMEFSKNIGGGQNIQVMFHVGDNVEGKVYNTMCFADANHGIAGADFEGRDHVPFVRTIGQLVEADFVALTDEQFPSSYTYSQEDQRFVYEIPYTSIGAEKGETVGFAILNVIFNSGANAWVYPAFGLNMPTDGTNVLNYQQFYDFDENSEYTARVSSNVVLSGTIKDETEAAVADANVTVTDEKGTVYNTTTDAEGKFTLEVGRLYALRITVSKDKFSLKNVDVTLAELQAENVQKEIVLENLAGYADFTGNVKNMLNGAVGGVKVTVKGTDISATTNADGEFTLQDAPVGKEGLTLIYSATGYTEQSVDYPLAFIQLNGENTLDGVVIYSEFGGNGHTKFSIVREETGLRVVFETKVSFDKTAEYYWAAILVDDTVYTYALQPNDSAAQNTWGVDSIHPRFTREVNGEFGVAEVGNDTWVVTGTTNDAKGEWFVPYSDLGMEKGDEFGFAVAPILYAGFPNCVPFAVNYSYDIVQNPAFNKIPVECFYMFGTENNYSVREA